MSETVVRKRGRPPKKVVDPSEMKVESNVSFVPEGFTQEKDIHNMVRGISRNGQKAAGMFPVEEVDEHVRNWMNRGFSLFATHYLGEIPEGYMVMYILVKQ